MISYYIITNIIVIRLFFMLKDVKYREGITHTDNPLISSVATAWMAGLYTSNSSLGCCVVVERCIGCAPFTSSRPAACMDQWPLWAKWLVFLAPLKCTNLFKQSVFKIARSRPKLQRREQRSETRLHWFLSLWWHQFDSRYLYTQ